MKPETLFTTINNDLNTKGRFKRVVNLLDYVNYLDMVKLIFGSENNITVDYNKTKMTIEITKK